MLVGFFNLKYMIKLFKYDNYKVTISEEALLLRPFKLIWNRDRSISKDKALLELGFIYFACDPRSDYQFITDDKDRWEAIKEGEGLPEKWEPDKFIMEAMDFYNSFTPTSALLLEDARFAVNKLRKQLRSIDFDERDDKGKPIYALNALTATIKQILPLAKELEEAQRILNSELTQNSKMRGQGEKTIFEDDLNN
jgi:hypothetical protein